MYKLSYSSSLTNAPVEFRNARQPAVVPMISKTEYLKGFASEVVR